MLPDQAQLRVFADGHGPDQGASRTRRFNFAITTKVRRARGDK
jgi:hypothetical protein